MSLESDLNRIATALEEIVKGLKNGVSQTIAAPVAMKEAKPKAAKAEPVVAEQDPFAPADEVGAPVVSFDVLSTLLKQHSIKFGTKVTIALMIKHGANASTPKLNTIPEGSYQACYDEACADLKKLNAGIKK